VDRLIAAFDAALRTIAGVHHARREYPGNEIEEADLAAPERRQSAALMRVNHVGEVCAQALYQGQGLTARSGRVREAMAQAALEEEDHLAWSAQRIDELGGRGSLLNALWYAGAFSVGAAAGLAGDRWSIAFLAETERQVEEHLEGHLARLSPEDRKTRQIVAAMRDDERKHRMSAVSMGAEALPAPVRTAMRLAAKVMTTLAYRV
jgi:ubiquinone biosynthesis monooxygenase Coq7